MDIHILHIIWGKIPCPIKNIPSLPVRQRIPVWSVYVLGGLVRKRHNRWRTRSLNSRAGVKLAVAGSLCLEKTAKIILNKSVERQSKWKA